MDKYKYVFFGCAVFIINCLVFYVSVINEQSDAIKRQVIETEKQVALDLPLIALSNELLKHSGNQHAVQDYLLKLNGYLDNSLRLVKIEPKSAKPITLKPNQFVRTLKSSTTHVSLVFEENAQFWSENRFLICLLFLISSILFSKWLKSIIDMPIEAKTPPLSTDTDLAKPKELALIIDLNTKTLSNNYVPDVTVCLANKPLCFYLALIEFCRDNNDVVLNQNKYVPDELIDLANKYFYRLIELGHTIRKRPNFNSSLEKTLSEIRAALDEVLNEYPDMKDIYYPPKAYGEGSRSRLHSYALINVAKGNIEIIGK
ncbi:MULTISPECIES: hypothetical protein [unclassified Pseudoalteromonas]|jgi:hypothetical protein|uniref:hypothetical protein n=1 Tax=unclassified Pseudoalteromonas TaxID=194690 RepID=UPI0025731F60|nr:hypothetical protein [Pseudoalteromonas sp. MM1]BED91085.1 hypothetical protein PspMM1_35530 [Pseudoalteromonas sp. MM1]